MEVSVHIAGEAWCVAFDGAASPAATCLAAAAAAAGVGLASQSTRAGLAKLSSSAKAEQDQDGHYAHSDVQLVPAHGRGSSRVTQVREVKSQWRGSEFLNLGNGCHKLIYLDLSGCTQISVQGFRNIASSCTGIMHLTINDMPTLTDNCVKETKGLLMHASNI